MASQTPLTILIVDDSPEDRAVCRHFLSRHMAAVYVCIEAATGTEALALCQSAGPDCLVLDFSLPDMDGLEFLIALQAQASPQRCPVVLLTGHGSEKIAVQAMHCGAQDYVVKGDLSADLLHRTITNAIEKFRLHQVLEEQRRTLHRQNLELRQREECLSALNATLEQRVAERTALLELLQDITIAANEATGSAEALQFAVDHICAYMAWPVGHAYLAVASGVARWAPTSIWHLEVSEQLTAFQQATQTVEFGVGEGIIGQVGARKQPAWSVDVSTDPALQRRHTALAAGLKAGFAFPILVGQESAGVLEFYADAPLAPNPPLFEALTQIGTQLGRVIEREWAAEQLQHKQEVLRQREKLAAMGSLLASVAHELNNPLAVILLQADLLHEQAAGGALAEHIEEITQAAVRCERLVRNFLTLAYQYPPERTAVDLNALITHTLELLEPALRVDTITVGLCLDVDLPSIWADADQIRQVLVNLITNAYQAPHDVKAARQVRLTTRCDVTRTRVTMEVADNGPGIPPALWTRIFEPFFTTKPPGVGTGLGLSLCQGIIEGHGGIIRVTSEPGQGTIFHVELPVGAALVRTLTPPQVETVQPVRAQTILVVDDEPSVIRGLTRLLRRDGHTVDTAPNGRLALARLQERVYDVILSDLRMPELDGSGLYRALEQQHPDLQQRFVFLTGDTVSPETMAFFEQSRVRWLTKPFRAAEVRRAIQQIMPAG
jgi:signal transduction histidine kinase/DNA-binding response OmpR family regulator